MGYLGMGSMAHNSCHGSRPWPRWGANWTLLRDLQSMKIPSNVLSCGRTNRFPEAHAWCLPMFGDEMRPAWPKR